MVAQAPLNLTNWSRRRAARYGTWLSALVVGCGSAAAPPRRSPNANADPARYERAKQEQAQLAERNAELERRRFGAKLAQQAALPE